MRGCCTLAIQAPMAPVHNREQKMPKGHLPRVIYHQVY